MKYNKLSRPRHVLFDIESKDLSKKDLKKVLVYVLQELEEMHDRVDGVNSMATRTKRRQHFGF